MNQSFYARHAWWTIAGLAVLFPAIVWGVVKTFKGSNNNVSQWLPQDYEETQIYQEFREAFGSDDFAVITWEGCTLDDDRLEDLARRLVPPPEESPSGPGSQWFQKGITGPRALRELTHRPF